MQKQKGITLIGLLLSAAIVIFLGLILVRVVPVYIENYEVKRSINSLSGLSSDNFTADQMSNAEVLRSRLVNQFDINSITSIKPEQINISPISAEKYRITVAYNVIRPFIGNISLLFNFKESQEVNIGTS